MKKRKTDHIVIKKIDTPLGPMVAGATGTGVCLLEFASPKRLRPQIATLERRFGFPARRGTNAHIERLRKELRLYFNGRLRRFRVPLEYPGTDFQVKVWRALLAVPYGETRSYEDVARAIGKPRAVRAVGAANGRNRIAIVIPCHRIIEKSGALGGYGGGLYRKRFLLELER